MSTQLVTGGALFIRKSKGGKKYFTKVWVVGVQSFNASGCRLPIEIWVCLSQETGENDGRVGQDSAFAKIYKKKAFKKEKALKVINNDLFIIKDK